MVHFLNLKEFVTTFLKKTWTM